MIAIKESCPRGRRGRFAKPLYGLKPVSRVRIPHSPPIYDFRVFEDCCIALKYATYLAEKNRCKNIKIIKGDIFETPFKSEFYDFLKNKLLIAPENILIRISSADSDLLDIPKECYGEDRMELDSRKIEYYRHKIGMEGVRGRNFNIALRNPDAEGFTDIGYNCFGK